MDQGTSFRKKHDCVSNVSSNSINESIVGDEVFIAAISIVVVVFVVAVVVVVAALIPICLVVNRITSPRSAGYCKLPPHQC